MEEVARYKCVYNRSSKDFKDKNKKANCWDKIGQKFNLSAGEAEAKFRNISLRTVVIESKTDVFVSLKKLTCTIYLNICCKHFFPYCFIFLTQA